jgi:hypothetical protein
VLLKIFFWSTAAACSLAIKEKAPDFSEAFSFIYPIITASDV